ncbi:NmrA-like negative transcriptional regulator family protein [Raphanus sativus]|uniref:Isoflavone reductase homolog P3-like n=1 Tax=Raphanus sativus TaxID=3726 RepID=A0A6J0JAY0_RAPSA|nr:isoflavone reductase homolog P3-like [Raphanus sativus]KAJ4916192.1 NmrA-like negative transcriptional regulator family protein [Raphanus sativus]
MASKILVIGATGYIGRVFVKGSVESGHATSALVRESSLSDPVKAKLVQSFQDLGVTILYGSVNEKESLVKAIKQVDVVISALGRTQILDQVNIIDAIKEAGNVKRFLPSEFGNDVDRTVAIEPTLSGFIMKAQIRRAIEAAEIPYTYVVSGGFAGYFVPSLGQCHLGLRTPPTDRVSIFDSGDAKAIINTEEDIVATTMKAVDDPKTLNKILYIHPPKNIVSQNDMVSLWERKIGKTLEKIYVSEEELLKSIQEAQDPMDVVMGLIHAILVQGELTSFTIDPSVGVEASELYPDVKYTSLDEFLNQFV